MRRLLLWKLLRRKKSAILKLARKNWRNPSRNYWENYHHLRRKKWKNHRKNERKKRPRISSQVHLRIRSKRSPRSRRTQSKSCPINTSANSPKKTKTCWCRSPLFRPGRPKEVINYYSKTRWLNSPCWLCRISELRRAKKKYRCRTTKIEVKIRLTFRVTKFRFWRTISRRRWN